jgi:hypothetical protein
MLSRHISFLLSLLKLAMTGGVGLVIRSRFWLKTTSPVEPGHRPLRTAPPLPSQPIENKTTIDDFPLALPLPYEDRRVLAIGEVTYESQTDNKLGRTSDIDFEPG